MYVIRILHLRQCICLNTIRYPNSNTINPLLWFLKFDNKFNQFKVGCGVSLYFYMFFSVYLLHGTRIWPNSNWIGLLNLPPKMDLSRLLFLYIIFNILSWNGRTQNGQVGWSGLFCTRSKPEPKFVNLDLLYTHIYGVTYIHKFIGYLCPRFCKQTTGVLMCRVRILVRICVRVL